jgi:uncharacterized membrane protein YfcA
MIEFLLEHIVFLICAFFAGAIATVAGFGSSTLMIPVAILFMEIRLAIVVVACFHLFNNLFKVKLFFKGIDFKLFISFGIPSIIFAFVGAYLSASANYEFLTKFMGAFLVVFAIFSFLMPKLEIKQNQSTSFLGGALSGFLAGLIGLGGAIRSMFLVSFNLPKEIYIATAALIALVVDLTRIPTYIGTGAITDSRYYALLPFLFVIAFLGVKTGKKFVEKVNQAIFRKLVLSALLLAGIKIFFS